MANMDATSIFPVTDLNLVNVQLAFDCLVFQLWATYAGGLKFMDKIVVAFNIAAIVFNALFVNINYANGYNCFISGFLLNLFSHFFFFLFDSYIFFKSYALTQRAQPVKYLFIVILLARVGVACWDLSVSYASWSPDDGVCNYNQDGSSGPAYNAMDLGADVVASVISIVYSFSALKSGFNNTKTLLRVLLRQNVGRCLLIVIVNATIIGSEATWDMGQLFTAYFTQNLVMILLINVEYLYNRMHRRLQGVEDSGNSTNGSQLRSGAAIQGKSAHVNLQKSLTTNKGGSML